MLRSHRLLRAVHAIRAARRARARTSPAYDAMAEVLEAGPDLRLLETDGNLDETALDGFTVAAGRAVAAAARAGRAATVPACTADLSRALRKARRPPPLGTAEALAGALVDERVLAAVSEVLRWLALEDHAARPAWPAAYRDRHGQGGGQAGDPAAARAVGLGASDSGIPGEAVPYDDEPVDFDDEPAGEADKGGPSDGAAGAGGETPPEVGSDPVGEGSPATPAVVAGTGG